MRLGLPRKFCKKCEQELWVNMGDMPDACLNSWCEDYNEKADKQKQQLDRDMDVAMPQLLNDLAKIGKVVEVSTSQTEFRPDKQKTEDFMRHIMDEVENE